MMGITTQVLGGDGGNEFNDGYHDRIVEITIHSGKIVDGLSILYSDAKAFDHGGKGGEASMFTLEDDEYIDEVTVQAAHVIVRLEFKTNLGRTFSPCKGDGLLMHGGKGHTHVIKAPRNQYALKGIMGREGKFLDAIGLHWGPVIHSTDIFGGDGGEDFHDGDHDRIVQITVNAGKAIEGLTIIYDSDESFVHGREGDNASTFTLEADEYITEVTVQAAKAIAVEFKTNLEQSLCPSGGKGMLFFAGEEETQIIEAPAASSDEYTTELSFKISKVIVGLEFKTNFERSFSPCEGNEMLLLGGEAETRVFEALVPRNGTQYVLKGMKGRHGNFLNAIGLLWGPPPSD